MTTRHLGKALSKYPPGARWAFAGMLALTVLILVAIAAGALRGSDDDKTVADGSTGATTTSTSPGATSSRPTSPTTTGSVVTMTAPVSPDPPPSPGTSADGQGGLAATALPPGVLAQFEYFNVGDRVCLQVDTTEPTVSPHGEQFLVLTQAILCLGGFDFTAEIGIEVIDSLGVSSTLQYPRDAEAEPSPENPTTYVALPLDVAAPEGRYTVTARQGEATSTTSFTVVQPSTPLVRVVPPYRGAPGSDFHLQLAGFAPHAVAHVDVYLPAGPDLQGYVTTIDVGFTDGLGHAEHILSTTSADEPGMYCLVGRGAQGECSPSLNEIWLE